MSRFSEYDRRWGQPRLTECTVDDCNGGGSITRGMCDSHYRKWLRINQGETNPKRDDRPILERIQSRADIDLESGCWLWSLAVDEATGYPATVDYDGVRRKAHIWAYEMLTGRPVPEGMELDHTCHNRDLSCRDMGIKCLHRRCVNPSHLEAVSHRVNVIRGRTITGANALKTHCKHGHEFTSANTYLDKNGHRYCRTCRAATERRRTVANRRAAQ